MSLENHKITTYEDNVSSLPDYPSDAGYTATMLKAIFDGRTDKEIKQKFNALIDELQNIISELEKADSTATETAKKYTDTEVTGHNSSASAHSDIRNLISELTRRLNALADSDDTTLDQLSELVAYIKDNRELIDSVTTAKANKADVYTKGNVDALLQALEESIAELEEKLKKLAVTGGGGNGVPLISVHDELYSEIVPEDGQIYVVKYDNVEASDNHVEPDENGVYPTVVTDTVRYRVKIGDGETSLADLPIVSSNLQAGEGNGSIVQIDPTYDEGDDCYCAPSIATGQLSAAFGKYNEVYGKASAAFGYNNTINVDAIRSFVAGAANTANAARVLILAYKSIASGAGAGIFGGSSNTVESGIGTILGGAGNKLLKNATRAILSGRGLISNTADQVVLGQYNAEDAEAGLIIGCGTSDTDRKNALVIKRDGTVVIDGEEIKTNNIEVNIPEGASVVLTDGYIELTGILNDSGNIVFHNIPYGMWTVKATINGREYATSVAVDGEEIPVMYFDEVLDNFADNTIEGIITACRTNTIPDTWLIGDKKAFTMDDKEVHLVIIGKNADTFTNGNTAPLTFQLEEIWKNSYMYTSGDTHEIMQWEDTRTRKYFNSATWGTPFFDTFKNAIIPVVKETKLVDGTIQITEDRIFIPSYEEMIEGGAYYEYFQTQENRVKTLDGTAVIWWTRTPYSASRYRVVKAAGTHTTNSGVSTKLGASPAFCLGSKTMFTNAIKVGDTVLTEEELLAIKASSGTADLSGFVTADELDEILDGITPEEIGASPSGHTHTAEEVGAAKIEIGSYYGTGETTKSLTFSFKPKFVMIQKHSGGAHAFIIGSYKTTIHKYQSSDFHTYCANGTWSENTLSMSGSDQTAGPSGAEIAMNSQSATYRYVAIG